MKKVLCTDAQFIVVEGMDGAGKDTVIKCLKSTFVKHHKHVMAMKPYRENSSVYEEFIKPYIRGVGEIKCKYSDFLLALMNEFKRTQDMIIDYINKSEDNVVILNRWFYSTLIYNARFKEEYDVIEYFTKDLLKPDRLYVLTAKPNICMDRILKRSGKLELHEDFLQLTDAYDRYSALCKNIKDTTYLVDIDTSNKSETAVCRTALIGIEENSFEYEKTDDFDPDWV